MGKFKLVQKAWKVYYPGMLLPDGESHPEFYTFDELETIMANTRGEAKTIALPCLQGIEPYEERPNIDPDEIQYVDLIAKRYRDHDLVEHEGHTFKREDLVSRLRREAKIQERREKVLAYPEETKFYVQEGFVGNSFLLWRWNNRGYTCNILEAQTYSRQEILDSFVDGRDSDTIWPAPEILKAVRSHVDDNHIDHSKGI